MGARGLHRFPFRPEARGTSAAERWESWLQEFPSGNCPRLCLFFSDSSQPTDWSMWCVGGGQGEVCTVLVPDIRDLQDHPTWSAWGPHRDCPAVQYLLGPVLLLAVSRVWLRALHADGSSPGSQLPREPKVRWWRKFLPNFSHIDLICNFLLWKYASILKSQGNNRTHQPYQHLAILVSSNPL